MRKASLVLLALVFALPLSLSAETWKNVALMDAGCAKHAEKLANPAAHTKACALKCEKAGFGAVVDGKFVPFDAKGNEMVKEALMKSEKKEDIRATVEGKKVGDKIEVKEVKFEK